MNIYVGNLSRKTSAEDLRRAFEGFGQVASATIITDKMSRQSRGFGFVEMPDGAEAYAAIRGLDKKKLMGRRIIVRV